MGRGGARSVEEAPLAAHTVVTVVMGGEEPQREGPRVEEEEEAAPALHRQTRAPGVEVGIG